MSVGVSAILGFLLYAGSDSAGAVTLHSDTLVSTVVSAPLGALSGVISERVGVVNIAIEGDLLVGAFAAIAWRPLTSRPLTRALWPTPLAGALLGGAAGACRQCRWIRLSSALNASWRWG